MEGHFRIDDHLIDKTSVKANDLNEKINCEICGDVPVNPV